MLFALRRWPDTGDGGPLDTRHGAQAEFCHGHESAGVTCGNRNIGFANLHGFERAPHAGDIAATAQRLARLLIHRNGYFAVEKLCLFPKLRKLRQNGLTSGLLPIKQENHIVVPLQRLGSAGYGNIRAKISAHDVNCNSDHASLILLTAVRWNFARKYRFRALLQPNYWC